MSNDLLSLIARLRTVLISKWAESNALEFSDDDREDRSVLDGANCVASPRLDRPDHHALLIDLDVPAFLVPSSTAGHSHLYVDVSIPTDRYFALLDALADAGVIEIGYALASRRKGGSHLRLPWVKRETPREVRP